MTALVFSPVLVFSWLYFFTNLLLTGVIVSPDNVRSVTQGPLYHIFDVHIWTYFVIALYIFIKKYRAADRHTRSQIAAIIGGTYGALAIAGVSNIILLSFFQDFRYIWIGPLATVIWIGGTGYAVVRLQFLNVKAILSETLVVVLWLVLLIRIFLSENQADFFVNTSFFIATLGLGIYLISIIITQTDQRLMIESQEQELARMNGKQEALLHFISHEIKGYFAKSEAAFAGIQEGDYGPAPSELKRMAANALDDTRTGASMAINILDASNLKQGAIGYTKQYFDFGKAVLGVVSSLRRLAEQRSIFLEVHAPASGSCMMYGDELKLVRHVITNLIDNGIRYTREGSVVVTVSCQDGYVRLSVKDTGVGITPEDRAILFTEGGHGARALEINVHATGYGLFIAKQVIDAHRGDISVLSDGENKGSEFVVTLPIGERPNHSSARE